MIGSLKVLNHSVHSGDTLERTSQEAFCPEKRGVPSVQYVADDANTA